MTPDGWAILRTPLFLPISSLSSTESHILSNIPAKPESKCSWHETTWARNRFGLQTIAPKESQIKKLALRMLSTSLTTPPAVIVCCSLFSCCLIRDDHDPLWIVSTCLDLKRFAQIPSEHDVEGCEDIYEPSEDILHLMKKSECAGRPWRGGVA